MTAVRILVLVVGIVVLVGTANSVLTVLIVPRPATGLVLYPVLVVRVVFRKVAQLTRTYQAKDRILAVAEPVALVVLLITWLTMTMFGFTLVNWGIGTGSIATAFSEAGSSVFTLGFTLTHTEGSRAVDFVAAGTGMVLVALQIAYLPTLYSAYNRRETLVTLLESRAGSPAWGPELLIRHQLVGTIDNLPNLFAEWERWAADVAESHSTYPSLLYLRSPRARNSWIVSLIAVLDAAALNLAMDPVGAPIEARMCIRMGFTCLRDIAQATRIPFDPDPDPDHPIALDEAAFDQAYDRLVAVGLSTSRPKHEAWAHFRGWRVNYEAVAYDIAYRLDAPPAKWTGPRRQFRGESMEPVRPTDRQPSSAPSGPPRIATEGERPPDGPQL
ncbi:MAG TPA: hypothetical protein VII96_05310 [Acidimicrobiales bacterium]